MPESKEFEPDLPKWLRESYKEEYQEVLGQELEKIKSNPTEYFGEQDLAPEEIVKLATEAQEILFVDFDFEGVHERMQAILSANIYESEKLAEDYKDAFTSLVKNVEMAVLRRMVSEYLPR